MSLTLVPVTFAQACEFIAEHHRHLGPPQGHKWSTGVAVDQVLVGVIVVGRPIARANQDGQTLEVTRVATDGTGNAASMLYGAAWRAAQAQGYTRLITSTRTDESGTSLVAAGWREIGKRPAHSGWNRPSRARQTQGSAGIERTLWEAPAERITSTRAFCLWPCGAELSNAEARVLGGMCEACFAAVEGGHLEVWDLTVDDLIAAYR